MRLIACGLFSSACQFSNWLFDFVYLQYFLRICEYFSFSFSMPSPIGTLLSRFLLLHTYCFSLALFLQLWQESLGAHPTRQDQPAHFKSNGTAREVNISVKSGFKLPRTFEFALNGKLLEPLYLLSLPWITATGRDGDEISIPDPNSIRM